MSKLVQGLKSETVVTKTENGMKAYKSTSSACLDLFFLGGSYRTRADGEIVNLFTLALQEDKDMALKIIAYLRDAREGVGERRFFRECLKVLASREIDFNLPYIAELGRWDDLLVFIDTPFQGQALQAIADALHDRNALCAKWMPRKGKESRILREFLKMYPKDYRKLLVSLTNVVETSMCRSEWSAINYEHVPSVANVKYNGAFLRNDETRRREFLAKAVKGEAKINAATLMPHQIIQLMMPTGEGSIHVREGSNFSKVITKNDTAIALWNNLKDVSKDSSRRILPVCDTSGSMRGMPILVSLGLGLFLSERMPGIFQNSFVTFSKTPEIQYVEGDIYEKLCQIRAFHPSNTNLNAVFDTILKVAVKNSLSEDEMPTDIVVISDMEFDTAFNSPRDDAFAMIRKEYATHGYDMPNIIFWNVDARNDHSPISRNSKGVALISGSSQNAINSVMKGVVSPIDVMESAVSVERYEKFLIPVNR